MPVVDAHNRESTQPVKRVIGRPFKKGNCANPGGKPKADKEIKKMCQDICPAVIERFIDIALHGDEDYAIAAGKELLNRGFGKAESFHTERKDDYSHLTEEQLDALIEQRKAEAKAEAESYAH